MKGFLLGLLVAALGLGGYYLWKQRLAAYSRPTAVADGGAPAREVKEKKKRRRRGAQRLARGDVFGGGRGDVFGGGRGDPFGGPTDQVAPSAAPAEARPSGLGASATEVDPDERLGLNAHAPARQRGRAPAPPPPPVVAEPEPVKLSASDLRLVTQGDDLGKPDVLRLDMSNDNGPAELSQDDIDAHFRAKEDAILGCIAKARPDEETYVPGRVTVKFRIQRTGSVRGVRVEAPAILQRGGLTGCVKGVVGGIHFPASSGSQIVAYPFSLT
jgi:hypothetical protein